MENPTEASLNRVSPAVFAVATVGLSPSPFNDPLGALDSQGSSVVIDSNSDPQGALDSQAGRFDPSPRSKDADRLRAKTLNVVSLASTHNESYVEKQRAKLLTPL